MNLKEMSMAELVKYHNSIPGTSEVGPKAFKSKAQAIERIEKAQDFAGMPPTLSHEEANGIPATPWQADKSSILDENAKIADIEAFAKLEKANEVSWEKAIPSEAEMAEDGIYGANGFVVDDDPLEEDEAPVPPREEEQFVEVVQVEDKEPVPLPTPKQVHSIKPRRDVPIRQISEDALVEVDPETGFGISYQAIIARVKTTYPDAETTVACLRWYAVRLREQGTKVPQRPRAVRS